MNLLSKSRKEIGALGEKIAAEYLRRRGMKIIDANVARKTGELDLVAKGSDGLHFVEVKTILVGEFPSSAKATEGTPYDGEYDPALNLHEAKIRRVARTGEWYVAEHEWEGDWQVDGCLVWLRRRDGMAHVTFLPQIV